LEGTPAHSDHHYLALSCALRLWGGAGGRGAGSHCAGKSGPEMSGTFSPPTVPTWMGLDVGVAAKGPSRGKSAMTLLNAGVQIFSGRCWLPRAWGAHRRHCHSTSGPSPQLPLLLLFPITLWVLVGFLSFLSPA
jgi:hypothetical protein